MEEVWTLVERKWEFQSSNKGSVELTQNKTLSPESQCDGYEEKWKNYTSTEAGRIRRKAN